MPKIDEEIFLELCNDPEFPCGHCISCRVPKDCSDKFCLRWRRWFTRDWLKIQLKAKTISLEEFNERIERTDDDYGNLL